MNQSFMIVSSLRITVSLLRHVSKFNKRILSTHKLIIIWKKNSKYVRGFRRSHGTQRSLMIMLQKCKDVPDKGEYIHVLFIDLSKTFDTINHDSFVDKIKSLQIF